MSSPNQRQRPCAHLVTYRLIPNAPVEQVFHQGKIFHNLSEEPGFKQLFWGRWTEDESCIDILITWHGDVNTEITMHHLSPLNPFLRPDCVPSLKSLDSSFARLFLTKDGGAHVSLTSFRIPASVYAADSGIKEQIVNVFQALALGDPRHGSHTIPPSEEEIPISRKIGTATSNWDSAWVVPQKGNDDISVDRNWIACIQWERPHFEREFKDRRQRHFNLRLQRLNGVRGLDIQDLSVEADLKEETDQVLATRGFWRPVAETWDAQFEEHHVMFHQVDEYNSMAGNGGSWSSCIIQ